MDGPQISEEGVIHRDLERDEVIAANLGYRKRLSRVFGRYPKIRSMVAKEVWDKPPGTEKIEYPKDKPLWRHTISRPSTVEIVVRSQSLTDPDLIEESLHFYLSGAKPSLEFSRLYWEKPPEVYDSRTETLPEAESFVSRIEQQLGPLRLMPTPQAARQ